MIIGASLFVIATMLVVWSNTTLLNLSQKSSLPKFGKLPANNPQLGSLSPENDATAQVTLAKQDAQQRFGLTNLVTTQVLSTNFSDSSLGCPKEGEFYSQIETPGWIIKLQRDDKTFEYHTDKGSKVVFCQ